jgi:hypothetical protein
MERHIRTTELYKERLAQWREEHADERDAEPPTPSDVAGELLGEALFEFRLTAASDVVEVTLVTGVEPFWTNGRWDPASSSVTWSQRLAANQSLPSLSYAAWSRPNKDTQSRHFGRVVLEGEDLAKYVLGYHRLSPVDARRWDGLVEGLRPEEDIRKVLREFCFADEPPPDPSLPEDEQPSSRADTLRALIVEGLKRPDRSNYVGGS